jgi:hypothetical protein
MCSIFTPECPIHINTSCDHCLPLLCAGKSIVIILAEVIVTLAELSDGQGRPTFLAKKS